MNVPRDEPYAVLEAESAAEAGTAVVTSTERWLQAEVVLSMYIGYGMFMVLRMAPAPVSNSIIEDPSLGITVGDWGRIMATGTVGAVVGKFIGGYAADRFGGAVTFAAGLLICALGIGAFAMSTTAWMFQAAFFLALMAKSSGWPGMTRIVGQTIRPEEYGRVWGILSTSSRVGTLAATLGLGIVVAMVSWRSLLLLSAAISCVAAVLFLITQKSAAAKLLAHRQMQTAMSDGTAQSDTPAARHPLDGTTLLQAIGRFCLSPRFWLIIGSLSALTILWDFLLFLPLFLRETVGMSERGANIISSAFPAGSFVSVLAGGFVFDLLRRRTSAWLMGALLLLATGCIGVFWIMPSLGVSEQVAVVMSAALLFVFGLCIAPCYYIPMSVFSIQFGGPHAGFLVALLDAVAFLVNAGFYWFGGDLAEESWSLFLVALGTVGAASAVLTWAFMLAESLIYDAPPVVAPEAA